MKPEVKQKPIFILNEPSGATKWMNKTSVG